MRIMNRGTHKGFTLIELMIVVAIVGILAVLAVVGVRRYLSNSKSAEARNALGAIGKGAAQALEREATTTGVIGASSSAIVSRRLCLSAVPVPSSVPAGRKYQSSNVNGQDWHTHDGAVHTGFACIRFEMMNPQSYMYGYLSNSTSTTQGTGTTAWAAGDLNGDGLTSFFELNGLVQSQALVLAPSITETNPDE